MNKKLCWSVGVLLLCLVCFLAYTVWDAKQAAKEEVRRVGENINSKVDATADKIKDDYNKGKEAAKAKYNEWKDKKKK